MASKDKRDNRTHAQKRRAEYQEEQRQFLRGLGLIQKICKDVDEVEHIKGKKAKGKKDAEEIDLNALKFKTETRLKLLNKILPDLKATEITGPGGEAVTVEIVRFADSATG